MREVQGTSASDEINNCFIGFFILIMN